MAKVTSKLQVTVPKALATQYRIRPGDDLLWVASGDAIRVVPARSAPREGRVKERLRLFDQATRRQADRQRNRARTTAPKARGWARDELYERARSR
jgi:bifunctional DNA-binding transcriptional regulator/antitoxin component of YhaV-PrlF toxin-antitoxin module